MRALTEASDDKGLAGLFCQPLQKGFVIGFGYSLDYLRTTIKPTSFSKLGIETVSDMGAVVLLGIETGQDRHLG